MAELTLVLGYIPRWYSCLKIIYSSNIRAKHTKHSVTMLIRYSVLNTSICDHIPS